MFQNDKSTLNSTAPNRDAPSISSQSTVGDHNEEIYFIDRNFGIDFDEIDEAGVPYERAMPLRRVYEGLAVVQTLARLQAGFQSKVYKRGNVQITERAQDHLMRAAELLASYLADDVWKVALSLKEEAERSGSR